MLKIVILCSVFAATFAGVIREHSEQPLELESEHHHKIDHEHATSHQSFHIHHYHAVPVYVKHEDLKYLKHPVEVGDIAHKLKVLHPETEQSHSHGLTLENHTEGKDYVIHGYEGYEASKAHHQYETIEQPQEYAPAPAPAEEEPSGRHFQDITVHHGHHADYI